MKLSVAVVMVLTGCFANDLTPPTQPGFPTCGDGVCAVGESRFECPQDCLPVAPPVCGNGTCEPGESCGSCARDCGACQPPCDAIELGAQLPVDVTGAFAGAPVEAATTCGDGPAPTVRYHWIAATTGVYDVAATGDLAVVVEERAGNCHGAETACGAALVVRATAGQTFEFAVAGASGNYELTIARRPDACGNALCEPSETCDSCAADCGACPVCGDGVCNGSEDCNSCAGDCGTCPICGDGVCNAGEDCNSCAGDCGTCGPSCGDGICDAGEDCNSCSFDCGTCPSDPPGTGGDPGSGSDPGTDPGSDPGTDPGSDPGSDPGTDPGSDPGTDPGSDPGTDPSDPGDDPPDDPVNDPIDDDGF